MKLEDFGYDLPPHLIAQIPIEPRDASRLMVLDRQEGSINHDYFYNLTQWLRPTDILVLNRTKVLPARLVGLKEETGACIEVLLLRPVPDPVSRSGCVWEVLLRPAKRLKVGQRLVFAVEERGGSSVQMRGRLLDILSDGNRIMGFEHEGSFEEKLEKLGRMPLPPYITAELEDQERYQTVYARETGSAAAPTAGLHFTPELLRRIRRMGVEILEVLLHVGLGTFRPVQQDNILDHKMHAEYYEIDGETAMRLHQAKAQNRRIVAVGTTVARALESWGLGGGGEGCGAGVGSTSGGMSTAQGRAGWTDIFIYPGYTFRWVDALVTNFHFPRSTLLMLVSALAGRERILAAYEEAIREEYRFYSFGDGMFIK
ncbi:MAG: tRNA preQ1(34) S-adenosylmethionine ribosyltransferase-isomerase QueA [Peptococcaceae bacterium]|nr:tRNA preQ1(34) S-adenosylmethionine ribosyltransferase-isomerase QueA [Peptococcaceae bacterium]